MKNLMLAALAAFTMVSVSGCNWSEMTPTQKGALTGAAVGAAGGALLGPDKALQNAAIGAAAGTALGAGAGYISSR